MKLNENHGVWLTSFFTFYLYYLVYIQTIKTIFSEGLKIEKFKNSYLLPNNLSYHDKRKIKLK